MVSRLRDRWRRITLRRHKIELGTLRFARWIWPMSVFPIFANLVAWWFLAVLPIMLIILSPMLAGIDLFDPVNSDGPVAVILRLFILLATSAYGLVFTIVAAPWFFRWYFIAVGLMFGRTAMADRKEAELVAAIAAAERDGVA
jgi:hypothetical protein